VRRVNSVRSILQNRGNYAYRVQSTTVEQYCYLIIKKIQNHFLGPHKSAPGGKTIIRPSSYVFLSVGNPVYFLCFWDLASIFARANFTLNRKVSFLEHLAFFYPVLSSISGRQDLISCYCFIQNPFKRRRRKKF
jgi:hypothetical protein